MTEQLRALLHSIARFVDEFEIADAREGEFYFRIEPAEAGTRARGSRWVVHLAPRGFAELNHWSGSQAARFTF